MQVAQGPYPHLHTEWKIMGMGPGIRFNKGLQEILMYTCLKTTNLLERSNCVNPVCRVIEMLCMCVGGPCQTHWQQGESLWPKGHVNEEQGLASGDLWEYSFFLEEVFWKQLLYSDFQGNRCHDRVKTVKGIMWKAWRKSCPRLGLSAHSHHSFMAIPVSCWLIAQAQVHSVGQTFRRDNRGSRQNTQPMQRGKTWHPGGLGGSQCM